MYILNNINNLQDLPSYIPYSGYFGGGGIFVDMENCGFMVTCTRALMGVAHCIYGNCFVGKYFVVCFSTTKIYPSPPEKYLQCSISFTKHLHLNTYYYRKYIIIMHLISFRHIIKNTPCYINYIFVLPSSSSYFMFKPVYTFCHKLKNK